MQVSLSSIGGVARHFLRLPDALQSILHDARMYPDPESFARVLVVLAGGEATPCEVREEDSGWPVAGVWYRPPEAEEPQVIRDRGRVYALHSSSTACPPRW